MALKKLLQKPRICLIGTDWGNNEYRKIHNKPGAISQYRLIYPMRMLSEYYDFDYWGSDFSKKEDETEDDAEFLRKRFGQYDLVISKVTDSAYAASSIRFMTEHLNIPLVVDIDDNIWELKEDQPAYKQYAKGSTALGVASTFVSMADAVFASTAPLANYIIDRINIVYKEKKDVYALPNCIDPTDYQYPKAVLSKKKIVIGWQGSTTHHEDLKLAMPAIGRLLVEYPNLYLQLLGGVPQATVKDLFKSIDESVLDKISSTGGCEAFDKFPKLLSEQAWDIAIAPVTDEVFNHAKSHIKWMEYAMYEIPCVASDVYPYKMPVDGVATIEEGVTGLLAKPDEWYEKLKVLIDDKEKRIEIGKNAKVYVSDKWNIYNHKEKYKETIDKLLGSRT